MSIYGVGAYEGCERDRDLQDEVLSIIAAGADTIICHRCPALALRVALHYPNTRRILRGDDGNDAGQYSQTVTPDEAAESFYQRFIKAAWVTGYYTAVHGPCEWLANSDAPGIRFRFLMETCLARIVKARCKRSDGTPAEYVGLACPVGNVDAGHLAMWENEARAFFEAIDILNYHGYLREYAVTVGQEIDGAYLWRPLDLWLPMQRLLGMRTPPILLGEAGTFYSPPLSRLSQEQEARLVCDIARAYEAKCRAAGVQFIGALPFGFGTVGSMSDWDQRGQGGIYRDALATEAANETNSEDGTEMTIAEIEQKIAHLERQNALLTEALKALRENRWTGADGVDGQLVAMTGKDDFARLFPKA